MKLRVQNLGPIVDAELELDRPLTVLVGPNGTGKTWMGWVVYGMWRSSLRWKSAPSVLRDAAEQWKLQMGTPWAPADGWTALGEAAWREVLTDPKWLTQQLGLDPLAFSTTRVEVKDPTLSDRVQSPPRWTTQVGMPLEIARASPGTVVWSLHVGEDEAHPSPGERAIQEAGWDPVVMRLQSYLASLIRPPQGQIHLFTIERMALQSFATELTLDRARLADELALGPVPGRRIPRYPLPIRDSLYRAADLAARSRGTSPYADLADWLEREVLRGRVHTSEYHELRFAPAATDTSATDPTATPTAGAPAPSLDLRVSAAMVKSLAPLVFTLRHEAQPGDWILIDEPELGLHPDNQRRVARALARAARRGLRVLVSTHSDWILEELSTLLMASRLPEAEVAEYGIDPAELLREEDLRCTLFRLDGRVEPVVPDEYGLNVRTIAEETHRLHDLQQRLYFRLFG